MAPLLGRLNCVDSPNGGPTVCVQRPYFWSSVESDPRREGEGLWMPIRRSPKHRHQRER